MMLVALGWQMYDLTGSAWDLGLVGLLQFLPALALVLALALFAVVDVPLQPVLQLETLPTHGNRPWRGYPGSLTGDFFDVAKPLFRYADVEVRPDEPFEFVTLPLDLAGQRLHLARGQSSSKCTERAAENDGPADVECRFLTRARELRGLQTRFGDRSIKARANAYTKCRAPCSGDNTATDRKQGRKIDHACRHLSDNP